MPPNARSTKGEVAQRARGEITKEKALVYKIMADVVGKFIVTIAATGVFIAVTAKLIMDASWPMATAESFLALTVGTMFRHYFPARTVKRPKVPKA